jgi:hypothetical protein
MIFALTVDTEADDQWDHGTALKTENVRFWEPFQAVCDKHGIKPTYLVTSEIISDVSAQALLGGWLAAGKAEVGAHLHPWTTAPFLDKPGFRFNDPAHGFLCEFPEEMIRSKLETLTREIEAGLGFRPTSFRAGRFGLDERCAKMLAELGYTVDSSVTPLTKWSRYLGLPAGSGGPDFTSHDANPFLIQGTGNGGLLEVPVTIIPTYSMLRRSQTLLRLYCSLPVRAARRLVLKRWLCSQPVWLRPRPEYDQSDLQKAYERQRESSAVAVMMFHSSELMPGGSPYRPTPSSVHKLLALLDDFFEFVVSHEAVPATLSDAALELRSRGNLAVRAL